MSIQGPFVLYIENGQQVLKPMPRLGQGGGNGNTVINNNGIPTLQIQTIGGTGGTVNSATGRNLLVLLQLTGDGNVTLPALGNFTVGARITFVRESGDGIPTIVPSGGTVEVNGVTTASFTPYPLRSLQDSVTYLRVPDGWQREQGTPAFAFETSAVTPITLDPRPEGTQYVVATFGEAGLITLPAGALCRPGYRVLVLNNGDAELIVAPAGAEQINGDNAQPYYLPVGGSALFELADSAQWVALEQDESPPPALNAASANYPVGSWRGFGEQRITLTGVAQQTVSLPSVLTLRVGASILIENTGVDAALLVPDGGELINGLDRRTILKDRACRLVSNGVGWIATDGGRYTSATSAGTNPAVVPTWIDGPFFFTTTNADNPHVVQLPALADVQYGSQLWVFNNSLTDATLTPAGAETINGGATVTIGAGRMAIVAKATDTDWRALVGG